MSFRLLNIRLAVDEPESALKDHVHRRLQLSEDDLRFVRILRKSLDLRDKSDPFFVCSVEVDAPPDVAKHLLEKRRLPEGIEADQYTEPTFALPEPGALPLSHRPVVVGSGPAGLAAACFLAEAGYAPLVLERGRPVHERIKDVAQLEAGGPLNPESNYLFGEGGAGTFSDGKLTCRLSGPDVRKVLQLFAESKGKPSVLYDHRPHLGSNRLPAVVKALRRRILAAGGEFRFQCKMESLLLEGNRVRGLHTSSGDIPAGLVILAVGHSARDTLRGLFAQGVPMTAKPFQFGVRIEQPQEHVNRAQYGQAHLEDLLGAADYTLVARGQPDLFSFCMCAGGQIIPSVHALGAFCTNGMSLSKRASPYANSGLMVTLDPQSFPSGHALAGMDLQETHEARAFQLTQADLKCPSQLAADFLANRPSRGNITTSYMRGTVPTQLAELLPAPVIAALFRGLPEMDRRWRGQFLKDAVLVGPESRGSCPLRIERNPQSMESPAVFGLYPVGEGAGFAGGIVSAAVDGLRAAKAIIAKYAPLTPAR